MLTVGVTGGVAAGKTTVSRRLAALGAHRRDADVVAHELLAGDPDVVARIRSRYGDDVIDARGGIDRGRLGAKVFPDDDARKDLEAILHPRIRDTIDAEIARARDAGEVCVFVIEAALLVEAGRDRAYDHLLVVEAPSARKRARQVAAGRPEDDAEARLRAQAPAARKLLAADIIIWNDGDPEALTARCDEVWRALLAESARDRPGTRGSRRAEPP